MLHTLSWLAAGLLVVSVVFVLLVPPAAAAEEPEATTALEAAETGAAADGEAVAGDGEAAAGDGEAVAEDGGGAASAEADEAAGAKDAGDFLSYEQTAPYPRRSFGSLMVRLVLSMAVILGLIYGGLMLVRVLARKTKAAPKAEKLVRIVDRAMLDQKRAIYLVKVVDRLLVVGVGTNDVRTLAEIHDETVVENVQDVEFTGHLQSLLGRLAGRQS